MVRMKVTSGPYKGRVRDVTGQDPVTLLLSVFSHGWSWEIDYAHTTAEERFEGGRQDMIFRIIHAL